MCSNPLYSGTVLNYAVFTSEILDEPEQACEFSKAAYSAAIRDIQQNESLPNSATISKHSNLLLQLLLDDIQLWKDLHHNNDHGRASNDISTVKTTAPSSPVQGANTNTRSVISDLLTVADVDNDLAELPGLHL